MEKRRLDLIDTIRGFSIISMIVFHTCWIFSFLGVINGSDFLSSTGAIIWERTICCPFIFISGFSFCLSKHHLKNGLTAFLLGVVITIFSVIFLYEARDIFGVLWIIGLSGLIYILPDKYIFSRIEKKYISVILFATSFLLTVLTWNINRGYLGLISLYSVDLPDFLYDGYLMTFLGFMDPEFYSTDYFSFAPWFFVYSMGLFTCKITRKTPFEEKYLTKGVSFLSVIGRHSLPIYLIHPVVIYILGLLLSRVK